MSSPPQAVALTPFVATAAAWGLNLSAQQIAQFTIYAEELQQWNRRINLTAVTDTEAIGLRHFLDALACVLHWQDATGAAPESLLDIGSGAGFPGLPLKLWHPDLQLTLVESVGKKAAFLEHLIRMLGLVGVTVLSERIEQIGHMPEHRDHYTIVTARAVAELRVLAEYGLPLLRMGGRLLAPKGAEPEAEMTAAAPALAVLGGTLAPLVPLELPQVGRRSLVIVHKTAATPERYPRAVGVPVRRPLR